MIRYSIEITHGSSSVSQDDRYRAEAAIDAALADEGFQTTEQLSTALKAYIARTECEDHDAALADSYERVVRAGDLALTQGWPNADGVSLSIGVLRR